MNALIFAAGLGTRLSHITQNKPKALVEVNGKPMLQHAIEKLINTGVNRIVINVHHYADAVKNFVEQLNYAGIDLLISDETDELLETGGGLLKAALLFNPQEPIFLYNADVITGVDLKKMYQFHLDKKGMATLMVRDRATSRYFLFDANNRLSGWKNISSHEQIITRKNNSYQPLAFSGIHIIEPEIIHKLGKIRKFSITNGYLDLSSEYSIYGWNDWNEYWFDVGTPEKLETANNYFNNSI